MLFQCFITKVNYLHILSDRCGSVRHGMRPEERCGFPVQQERFKAADPALGPLYGPLGFYRILVWSIFFPPMKNTWAQKNPDGSFIDEQSKRPVSCLPMTNAEMQTLMEGLPRRPAQRWPAVNCPGQIHHTSAGANGNTAQWPEARYMSYFMILSDGKHTTEALCWPLLNHCRCFSFDCTLTLF